MEYRHRPMKIELHKEDRKNKCWGGMNRWAGPQWVEW